MTNRLVPYRSPAQAAADANVMFVLNAAGAVAIGTLFADSGLTLRAVLAGVVGVASGLVSEAVADWRARRRGAELMPRPEMLKRFISESAAASFWRSSGSFALAMASSATVLALAILPIHRWPIAILVFAIVSVVGVLSGTYAWVGARQFDRAFRRSEQPSSFAELAMHHYGGYALGLAAALFVAPFLSGPWSPPAVFAAFLIGKLIGDVSAPAVLFDTAAEMPSSVGGLLLGCVWAIAWWGLPLGALLAIAVHNFAGGLLQVDLAAVFGIPAAMAVAFYLFLTALMYLARGRPSKS